MINALAPMALVVAAGGGGLLALALTFASVVTFGLATRASIVTYFDTREQRAEAMRRLLDRKTVVPMSVYGQPLVTIAVFVLVGASTSWLLGFILAVITYFAFGLYPPALLRKRKERFEEQLPDALTGLAHSTKAGMTLPQAMEQVAKSAQAPMSQELGHIMRDYRRGRTIEQALDDARDRLQSRNFDLAIRAFRIGVERGGNTAMVFEKIANSIREIWRVEERIRTVTSEGRSSARIMTVMPLVFFLMLYLMDSDDIMLLFTDPVGIGVLAVVIVLNVVCNLWVRRIMNVDV